MSSIFAITLPRSTIRHEHIQNELRRKTSLPYELLGVDGVELRASGAPWPHNQGLRDSEVGCALSHVTACRRIVELDLPAALIVEDDVILPDNIDIILKKLSEEIVTGEIISLYNRTLRPERFSTHNAKDVMGMRLLHPTESRIMRTAAAYFIDRSAAENIVRLNSPIQVVADNWMHFYQAGAVSTYRLLHPTPIRLFPFPSTLAVDRGGKVENVIKRIINKVSVLQKLLQVRRRKIERKRENNVILVDLPSDMIRGRASKTISAADKTTT